MTPSTEKMICDKSCQIRHEDIFIKFFVLSYYSTRLVAWRSNDLCHKGKKTKDKQSTFQRVSLSHLSSVVGSLPTTRLLS